MFRRVHDHGPSVALSIDGRPVLARPGESVAAALLAAGVTTFRRTAKTGAERGLYCGMGVCFECLVTIDGVANRQSCLIPVAPGMRVETGGAAPDLAGKAAS